MTSQQTLEQVTLVAAVERVEQNLRQDSKFKVLHELLRATPVQPSLSGLQDIDYPNMLNLSHKIPLVSNVTTVPLPNEVIEQYVNMQQNCALGIFTEISRAWLAVDNCIYFWAYDNASDVAYYDGLDQTILAVNLFRPKPNAFKPHIKYVLSITTAQEITLLGVTCSQDEPNTLPTFFIIPDHLFKLPTDDVVMSVLAGTDDGRIFSGGNDGCLYEISYQSDWGWFSRKCHKINHSTSLLTYITPAFLNFSEQEPIVQIEVDSSRHLLYTRTEKSTIILYDLGEDGKSMRQVCSKPMSSVVNQASCIARTIDTSNFKPIVGIKALKRSESESIHLVAVTQAGVRLYFSACGESRPNGLDLVHVRLPPGFTPSSAMQRPNSVSNIYHQDNAFVMTSTQSENKDILWVLSNDFYVYEEQMMELFDISSLNGRVWCIEEEHRKRVDHSGIEAQTPPLVVKQHYEERRKFVLLTSSGVHIFYKLRPIDQLQILLTENQGPEAPPVRSFFQSTKIVEACLTSLILASSSNLPQERQLVEWATLAFFRYGGEPRLIKSGCNDGSYLGPLGSPISSPIHMSNMQLSQHNGATQFLNSTALGPDQSVDVQYSARHNALYLYLARILRPLWLLKVASTETGEENQKVIKNIATVEEITIYLKRLSELKRFLDSNIPLNLDQAQQNRLTSRMENADATTLERESLISLVRLLNRCIEVLNLYKLVHEHQFSSVCLNLPSDPQMRLCSMTFRDLIVLGKDMTTSLASALVRRYLDDNISTDAISRRLHQLCPSIFRQENAMQARAHEMILQSRTINDKQDKERLMTEAVALLKKIGVRLDLQAICDLLHSAQAYKYIVDICLYVAEKRDPLNLAGFNQPRAINSALDEDGERARLSAVAHRVGCYVKIIDTLDRLINTESFDEVFNTCIKSSDELFHTKLYEWLCEKNLSSRLLDVQCPYVEPFLKKKAAEAYSRNYYDLLWRFYQRRGSFLNAAQILHKLASRPCVEYGLDERLEYLSRAKGCLEASNTPGQYLHEVEEAMEVLQIQIQIFKKIKDLPDTPQTQEAITQLNHSLLDLNQLYQNFAQKFGLFDLQLAILKCGNHYDPLLIEKLWKCIIDKVLRDNAHESQDTQLHILSNKIEILGKNLIPSERFFPVYFIVAYTEFKTYTHNNIRWMPHCLLRVGFKPINILEPYHKFYRSREHSTFWPGKPVHVLRVIANFMEETSNKLDKSFAVACLDVICEYLIDLVAMNSDNSAKKLQDQFTILQSKINKSLS